MSTLRELRTTISVVATEVASRCGWPTWTPMKTAPEVAAAIPAARRREFGVTVMAGPLSGRSVAGAAGLPGT